MQVLTRPRLDWYSRGHHRMSQSNVRRPRDGDRAIEVLADEHA
jgi:hypothetical protein